MSIVTASHYMPTPRSCSENGWSPAQSARVGETQAASHLSTPASGGVCEQVATASVSRPEGHYSDYLLIRSMRVLYRYP
jgi:hypothetical protein